MDIPISRIRSIISRHTETCSKSLNLVASENRMSRGAIAALGSDFAHRYAIPPRGERPLEIWDYPNQTAARMLEAAVQEEACTLFGGASANIRPLSGNNVAGIILAGLVPAGGRALTVPGWAGGHFATAALCKRLDIAQVDMPYDSAARSVDLEATARIAAEGGVDLVYLDSSMLLEAYPVEALRAIFPPQVHIVYDASHVFGLIAGGRFQDPIGEGAAAIVGSTHKSMFGPQKGIIVTAPGYEDLATRIDATVTPLFSSNPHVHHIAALGVALEELAYAGSAYADAVIDNAERFAAALEYGGLTVLYGASGRVRCHQVFVKLPGAGAACDGEVAMLRLEEAGLHVNGVNLPFREGQGLRIGLSEVTRLGLVADEIERIAAIVADVVTGAAAPSDRRGEVAEIAGRRREVYYTLEHRVPPHLSQAAGDFGRPRPVTL